ncbi:shikimate kinase [Amycolatopsis mediterranei]|uniref:shikimate kinase n=1 Tax=Amycolatopsis mediterranei TaxID=33910 RepID=UPI00030C4086|nr:shikimate kinase [Amycolatopsis mediterranei]KDO07113.1 shikimate kinase [Amycolatopsis mediterranei]KDU92538.1 shikimate kinase [Amycolatopsis mediterranei]UZF69710.1 shikimate kinase [Amycolatopsis mediterranei]
MTPRAVIVGPPGSGKSTVGPLLAAALGVEFRDSDDDVVARAGRSISDIFAEDGEAAFRALEEEAVATALAEHDGVLALGGGAPLTPGTRARLAEHTVVFLGVGLAAGVQRTGLSSARPLLAGVNPRATFKKLLDERVPVYREVATVEIVTDDRTPSEIVAQLVAELAVPAEAKE